MSQDARYKMQHIGDIFVDALSGAVGSAKKCARDLVLNYDIRDLNNKKRRCLSMIGKRVVILKKEGIAEFETDEQLTELVHELGKIDGYITSFEEKKKSAGCCGAVCADQPS